MDESKTRIVRFGDKTFRSLQPGTHMDDIREILRAEKEEREQWAQEAMRAGDWETAILRLSSEERVPFLQKIWYSVPDNEKPAAMALAISVGDAPSQALEFLQCALEDLDYLGTPAFDSPEARAEFALLPDPLTVYRGTVQAEHDSGQYGICWTPDRERAVWFRHLSRSISQHEVSANPVAYDNSALTRFGFPDRAEGKRSSSECEQLAVSNQSRVHSRDRRALIWNYNRSHRPASLVRIGLSSASNTTPPHRRCKPVRFHFLATSSIASSMTATSRCLSFLIAFSSSSTTSPAAPPLLVIAK
jgi:hypothetical protein